MSDEYDDIFNTGGDHKDKFVVIDGGKGLEEKRAQVRAAIKNFCTGMGKNIQTASGAASIIKEAVFAGLPKPEIDDMIEWACGSNGIKITSRGNLNRYYEEAKVEHKNAKRHEMMLSGDWKVHLQQDPSGRSFLSNSHNISLMLQNDPAFVGFFRYDEFRDQTIIVERPPWLSQNILGRASLNGMGWPMNDVVITQMAIELQAKGLHHAREPDVDKCLQSVAKEFRYNSLTGWLNELPWSGRTKINTWLITHCGAEDNWYTRLAGRWWLMSAVARAFNPGCKADYVLLLESPQGFKKSTMWMTVARRKEWYLEYSEDLNTVDGRRQLRGKWIVALPELSVLNRKEAEHVKAFVTRQMENVRDTYEKYHRDHDRSLVLCGDTNGDQYFSDPTGNRRFWPINCGRIDITGLDAIMDDLWAEAVHWYKNGQGGEGVWWPEIDLGYGTTEDERKFFLQFNVDQAKETEKRFRSDGWEDGIVDRLIQWRKEGREVDKLPGGTMLLYMIFSIQAKDIGQAETQRVNAIMKRLGYTPQVVWIEKAIRGYKYVGGEAVKWRG